MSRYRLVLIPTIVLAGLVAGCGSGPTAEEVTAARDEADTIIEQYREVFIEKGKCPLDVALARRHGERIEALGVEVDDEILVGAGAKLQLFVDAYEIYDVDEMVRLADELLLAADDL